jgi:4a-hydroxytetrahydrobiopterin dehydratase
MDLIKKKCHACSSTTAPLRGHELTALMNQLGEGWKMVEEHHLEKEYTFKNFKEALAFVNKVGAIAEEEGHHPDILLRWGKVKIMLWTHKIGGLSENDFILAAKLD